jgi:hypothetical protein
VEMSTPAASAWARMRSWISSLALMLNRLVPIQPMVTRGVTLAARMAHAQALERIVNGGRSLTASTESASPYGSTPGTAALTRVSSKKRNSRKRKTHPQGISGNPQRRAQQLRRRM